MLRLAEKIAAILLLILLLPLFLIVAFLVRITLGSPILFRQKRVGRDGKNFTFLKFRTMRKNAQREKISWKRTNPELWQEYCQNNFKLANDDRVIGVGKLLRKTSLDELPQLFNIIKGEMSFIGPRPILLREKKIYGKNLKYYQEMTPGITGLWQVSGRSKTSFKRRVERDLEFYHNRNLKMYCRIVIKTIIVIFHLNKVH